MKEKVLAVINRIKNTSYFIKLICFAAVFVITLASSLLASNTKFAFAVNYGGEKIALVNAKADYFDCLLIAKTKIAEENADEYFEKVYFSPVLTMPQYINSNQEVAEAVLNSTDALSKSVALSVDGETVALFGSREDMQSLLDKRLNQFNVEDAENIVEFTSKVNLSDVYCLKSGYTTLVDLQDKINTLSVKTTVVFVNQVVVPYKTITYKNNSEKVGYFYVNNEGVDGLTTNVEQMVYLDGGLVEGTKLSTTTVTEPVNKVVTVGTLQVPASNTVTAEGMIFPLDKSKYYKFTTYFQETDRLHYKPHKGLDIAAAKGSNIYAVKDGVVVQAGWSDSYGYRVKIDHGNGIETLYAHCKSLNVKVGQTVKQGQVIAFVGSTGYSANNHLHIEVIKDGKYVNPIDYIGS